MLPEHGDELRRERDRLAAAFLDLSEHQAAAAALRALRRVPPAARLAQPGAHRPGRTRGAGRTCGPPSGGTREARQNLNAACQWLWILNSSVGAAQRREPLRASDLELLRAIPANALPPRRLPAPAESVAGLCQGVISSAERLRHLSWASGRQPAWSPGLTVNSLRRIAATSTLTSHHCEVLLRSLAARASGNAPAGHATWLLHAAQAAGHARPQRT